MKNKKVYHAKLVYSLYMGLIMGFLITSGFFVIITNIDIYFFNSIIGISGDWLYYIGTILLIPIFGALYVYNKRIVIGDNKLEIRENAFSYTTSKMDISTIKSISLHKQKGRRRVKKCIKFADGEIAIMILTKPFKSYTLALLLNELIRVNPNIVLDDYFLDLSN